MSEPLAIAAILGILGLILAAFILVLALDHWLRERERRRREEQLDAVVNARARRERGDETVALATSFIPWLMCGQVGPSHPMFLRLRRSFRQLDEG